jgi:DNA-binding transcriptional LysR family regulator
MAVLHDFIIAYSALSLGFEREDGKVDLIEPLIDLAIRPGELQDSRLVAQ